jgi:dolichyl-phosphate beta-glucosyltransferase
MEAAVTRLATEVVESSQSSIRRRALGWIAHPVTIVMCGYLLGAVYVTSRLLQSPGSTLQNGDIADVDQATWFMRYAATAVRHFHLPALMATTMNAPHSVNLMWNTSLLLPGVVLSPVTLLSGPQVALTVLLMIGFAGSAASMYYVLRRWHASPFAAALGGALYGFSPALINSGIGHYTLVLAILPPLMLDRLLRLVTGHGRPVRNGIWLGLMAAAQIFISEEALVEAVIAAVLLVVVLALSRRREVLPRVRPTAIGLATAAVVGLVLSGRGLWVQFHGVAAKGASATTIISYHGKLTSLGTLPVAFINPSQGVLLHTAGMGHLANSYPQPLPEYLAYLGVPLILVLLVATVYFWQHLPIRVAGVTCVLLEWLGMGARPLQPHLTLPGFLLPWSFMQHLPVIEGMVPDRLAILADACAGAVIAFSLDLARSGKYAPFSRWPAGGRIAAGIGVLALLPLVPAPYAPVRPSEVPSGYAATFTALHLTADSRVLLAPYPYSGTTAVMRWQAQTSQPATMIGGDFIAPNQPGRLGRAGRSGMTPTSWYIDYLYSGQYPNPEPSGQQVQADLAAWDPAAVIAVTRPASRLGKFLIQLFGQPDTHIGSVLGWRLKPSHV